MLVFRTSGKDLEPLRSVMESHLIVRLLLDWLFPPTQLIVLVMGTRVKGHSLTVLV